MNYHELTLFFDWVGPIVAVAQVKEAAARVYGSWTWSRHFSQRPSKGVCLCVSVCAHYGSLSSFRTLEV